MKDLPGHERISRQQFYSCGGFSNPRCVRVQRAGRWAYFWRL